MGTVLWAMVAVGWLGWGECDQTAPREAAVAASGVREVRIRAEAGSLRVEGAAGAGQVRAHGTACASDASALEEIKLTATRQGDAVIVEVVIPESGSWSLGTVQQRLDLTVEVPAGVAVDVTDGSGATRIRGVGPLRVRDGSGELVVQDVTGDARIEDGSGSLEVARVSGVVTVEDGSGPIQVRDAGSVVIEEDGSGSIDVAQVKGSVLVRRDGSGSITARDIGGDLTVERDGSGGVQHAAVRGRVSVPRHDQ